MHIDIGGRKLFFDVEGEKLVPEGPSMREKPTLIVIHGAPGFADHSTFKPAFRALTDMAQVIYLDLSGCGRSDDIPEGEAYSLEGWADDVVSFCTALNIDQPFVLGVSGGGMVAQAYAIRHSHHTSGVVFANTQAKFIPEHAVAVFKRLGGEKAETAARNFLCGPSELDAVLEYGAVCIPLYNPTPVDPDKRARVVMRERVSSEFHSFGTGIWHRMDMLDDLKHVSCPVLVLAGEDDPITPVEDSDEIVKRLNPDQTTYVRQENCGHGNWIDHPEETFDQLRRFMSSNS